MNKIKQLIWQFNYLIYRDLRDLILFTGLWKHSGRQKFHQGFIKTNLTKNDLQNHLQSHGFEFSICSWIDDGEVLSMRKPTGKYQYHLRLFSDGELRGHYEYSPEGNPIGHLLGQVFKPEKQSFKSILNEFLMN